MTSFDKLTRLAARITILIVIIFFIIEAIN